MKVALVSTPGSFDIAHRVTNGALPGATITHYFKRGRICQKRTPQSSNAEGSHVTLGRMAMLRDIRDERFDEILVVELPHGRANMLPFYALVAILSKAPGKYVVDADGGRTTITVASVARLIVTYSAMFLCYLLLVPLAIMNLGFLLAGALVVDGIVALRSKPRNGESNHLCGLV